jgi:uncharacterized membrane protein
MSWIIYSLIGIGLMGVSDLFRKLALGLKDPLFTNLVFQSAAFSTAIILFLLFGRKTENNPKYILYAIIAGITICTFSILSFKALSTGPGVSVVMPVLRIGGVSLVAILGIFILKEKLTFQTIFGLLFSGIGIYLLFLNK